MAPLALNQHQVLLSTIYIMDDFRLYNIWRRLQYIFHSWHTFRQEGPRTPRGNVPLCVAGGHRAHLGPPVNAHIHAVDPVHWRNGRLLLDHSRNDTPVLRLTGWMPSLLTIIRENSFTQENTRFQAALYPAPCRTTIIISSTVQTCPVPTAGQTKKKATRNTTARPPSIRPVDPVTFPKILKVVRRTRSIMATNKNLQQDVRQQMLVSTMTHTTPKSTATRWLRQGLYT